MVRLKDAVVHTIGCEVQGRSLSASRRHPSVGVAPGADLDRREFSLGHHPTRTEGPRSIVSRPNPDAVNERPEWGQQPSLSSSVGSLPLYSQMTAPIL